MCNVHDRPLGSLQLVKKGLTPVAQTLQKTIVPQIRSLTERWTFLSVNRDKMPKVFRTFEITPLQIYPCPCADHSQTKRDFLCWTSKRTSWKRLHLHSGTQGCGLTTCPVTSPMLVRPSCRLLLGALVEFSVERFSRPASPLQLSVLLKSPVTT